MKRMNCIIALTLTLVLGVSPVLAFASAEKPIKASYLSVKRAPAPPRARRASTKRLQAPTSLEGQSVTTLPDGRVLLIGGLGKDGPSASVTISSPSTGQNNSLPDMSRARAWHSATMLPDGRVLIFGGIGASGRVFSGPELLDPANGAIEQLGQAGLIARAKHTATLLTDGRVLILGGVSERTRLVSQTQLWDSQSKTARLAVALSIPRHNHKATLLTDGNVLIEGGADETNSEVKSPELFNVESESLSFTSISSDQDDGQTPYLAASLPMDGASDVPVQSHVALRFSRPLPVEAIKHGAIKFQASDEAVAAKIVPAEHGRLAFITPLEPLKKGTTYIVTIGGTADGLVSVTPTSISFTTIADTNDWENRGPNDTDWTPDAENLRGNWRTKLKRSSWQDEQPLEAGPGETALSGQVLTITGQPLSNVTISVKDSKTRTDRSGRFLLKTADGHQVMLIDGRSASRPGRVYGIFRAGVDVIAGQTNVLSYTIWMPKLDMAHAVTIPSPNQKGIVITNPLIPGLELHLPPGTVIRDLDGKVVTQLSITPVPTDRPPFPLPAGLKVPVFASIQPGGARVIPPRARLIYPNYNNERPGARINFWNYDPEGKGWYIYGQGTVTPDGRQIVPDPGVVIYEFNGIMIGGLGNPPDTGPEAGDDDTDGDPVDLSTGLFVLEKTDLVLPDTIPIALKRTYRPGDAASRPFGIGSSHPYELFLWSNNNYQEVDLILPDGGRIHYVRISPGTGFADAVYEHTLTPSPFYKSYIYWNGTGWDLRFKNGTVFVFPEFAPLQAIRDRYGNQLTVTRAGGDLNITQLSSPNGRWLQFTYDTGNRIIQIKDNSSRTVSYTYDGSGRLWKVTNANGGITEYTYDSSHRMLTIKDARGIVYLANEYDSNDRVITQTQADNSTYEFDYTLDGAGKVTQTDVTDPRGNVRRVTFNLNGYRLTDTRAFGTSDAKTITYGRQSGSNLILSVTDAMDREKAYTYDSLGNLTSITRLAGTQDAVTTSLTYEPNYNRVASITDPLSHTTSFAYDIAGNLISATDPLSHQWIFTYNSFGQILTATDPLSHTSEFTYDSGDLVTTTDPLDRTTTRQIDAVGRVIGTTNAPGHITRYEYDNLNQTTSSTDALQGVTAFTYDENGNLLSLTDARNGVTSFDYDDMDRVTTRTDQLSHDETYQYDLNGNLEEVTDRESQITGYTYDALNRLTGVTYDDASTTTYTYDSGNRLTEVVDSLSGTITYDYDGLNRMTNETTPQRSISYTYDDAGRRTSMTVAGQSTVSYTYDNANRLTQITQGSATVTIAYDNANRRTSLTLPNGVITEYTYDAASQLTDLVYKYGTNTMGNLTYSYDTAGRRTGIGGSYARTGLPQAVTSATYDAANRQTAFGSQTLSYDLNGNLTSDGTNSYAWNARGQLVSISGGATASFTYDAFGRRATRTLSSTTKSYLYDGHNIAQELSGTTPVANILGGGIDEVFTRSESTGTLAPLVEGLGSTLGLSDSSGAVQTQYTYEPFGYTSVSGTASTNTSQFTGRENDGTGLYYYRARYYSPKFHRFVSQDPIGFMGGDTNLYAYVQNSPFNFVDPFGLDGEQAPAQPTLPNSDVPGFWPNVGDWLLTVWNAITPMGELTTTLQMGPDAYRTTQILIEQKQKRDEAYRCAFGDCSPSDDRAPTRPDRPDSGEPATPLPLDDPTGPGQQRPGAPGLGCRKC